MTRLCRGGPLGGRELISRFPDGFVLVNKAERSMVIYVYHFESDLYIARPAAPLSQPEVRRLADGLEYDVVAYDEEEMGPWPSQ